MNENLNAWVEAALSGEILPEDAARSILADDDLALLPLLDAAGQVRRHYHGKKVRLHQINNIQNGLCPEDCGYCGQSKTADQPLKQYVIKREDDIIADAQAAKERGVFRYCMVASGRGPNERQTDQLCRIVKRIKDEVGIRSCLSVGLVNAEQAHQFKEAGLDRLNHNLNTSEAHTPNVVSTHTFEDRMNTLRAAEDAGLSTCSGMIAGMGETDDDILEVAYKLREMKVPSIPINFLVPIEGNKLQDFEQLTPERCLRILCLFRLINPKAEIRVGGGREGHLRGMQGLALHPANSLFVEGYLVTRGDGLAKVREMIEDAGFEVEGEAPRPPCSKFQIDDDADIMHPETVLRA
jgi:biotin synthase